MEQPWNLVVVFFSSRPVSFAVGWAPPPPRDKAPSNADFVGLPVHTTLNPKAANRSAVFHGLNTYLIYLYMEVCSARVTSLLLLLLLLYQINKYLYTIIPVTIHLPLGGAPLPPTGEAPSNADFVCLPVHVFTTLNPKAATRFAVFHGLSSNNLSKRPPTPKSVTAQKCIQIYQIDVHHNTGYNTCIH